MTITAYPVETIEQINAKITERIAHYAKVSDVITRSWELMHADNAAYLGKRPPWWRPFARSDWNWRLRYPKYLTPTLAHLWDAADELDVDNRVFSSVMDAYVCAHGGHRR